MSKDTDKNGQKSEKLDVNEDALKDRINGMMNLIEEDDTDEEIIKELKKPKKKFLGLF